MPDPDWRHLPSLAALRAFEATARLGGFSAAARVLNVTQPAVAQQVRALEADLGVVLLRRDGRGLALTEDGTALARALGEGFSAIAAGVEGLRRTERGRGLRVSATPAFSQTVLMPRLGGFWARHPEIAVSLTPTYDLSDLARDGFDVGIRSGKGQWPGVVSEPVVESRFLLVATPGLRDRDGDIARLPWILNPDDRLEQAWLVGAGLDLATLTVNGIDNPMLAVSAARSGYGLMFATEVVVAEDLDKGLLVEVPFAGLPRTAYWAVTLPGPRRPAVTRFLDWLHGEFGL